MENIQATNGDNKKIDDHFQETNTFTKSIENTFGLGYSQSEKRIYDELFPADEETSSLASKFVKESIGLGANLHNNKILGHSYFSHFEPDNFSGVFAKSVKEVENNEKKWQKEIIEQKGCNQRNFFNLKTYNKLDYPFMMDHESEARIKTMKFQEDSIYFLKKIDKNTAGIPVVIELIHESNENQKIMIDIITEILLIGTAKNNNEATSKLQSAIDKINKVFSNVDTITKLINFAFLVYENVKKLFV